MSGDYYCSALAGRTKAFIVMRLQVEDVAVDVKAHTAYRLPKIETDLPFSINSFPDRARVQLRDLFCNPFTFSYLYILTIITIPVVSFL